jgi:hypothetical protein
VLVSQLSGAQLLLPRAVQVPAPSQVFGFCDFLPLQVAGAHTVPAIQLRQAPAPLQLPSYPQLVGAVAVQRACGSVLPAATLEHAPRKPGTLQAWQVPQLAAPQQTPSTHQPLSHSVPDMQPAPSSFFRHTAPEQVDGGTQSLSSPQGAAQAPARQTYGVQSLLLPAWHRPAPSHIEAPTTEVPAHVAGPQAVPAT